MGSHYFQDRSFQLSGARLFGTEANDSHLSATAPTQQQEQEHLDAIGVLKYEDDRCIFAGLDVARSFEPRLQDCSSHTRLTRDQVHAILALRHCKNNDISTWLHLARASRAFPAPTQPALPYVLNRALDQAHAAPPVFSNASTLGPVDHSCDNEYNRQANKQSSSKQPFPTSTITPPQAKPKYCCTLCDRPRPFKNQSDWKKHEKEHDTDYVCMLGGPKEATPQGIQCAFCGILDPDDDHLSGHNTQACPPGSPEAFSTKRRYEMVSHLRVKHGINIPNHGEAIAGKWKNTMKKQAWSCCFCIKVFASFNERLSHIASEHYEHGHTIEEWDATNVIQGLLQQPGMIKAWEQKVTSLSPWEVPDIIWQRDAIEDLQQDLEVGPSDERTAVVLAEAAYTACRMNWGMESKRPRTVTGPESGKTDDTTPFSSSPFPAPTISAPIFAFNHSEPPSTIQEPNGFHPKGLVNQDNLDHVYSNESMYDWNYDDDDDGDSLASTYQYQA